MILKRLLCDAKIEGETLTVQTLRSNFSDNAGPYLVLVLSFVFGLLYIVLMSLELIGKAQGRVDVFSLLLFLFVIPLGFVGVIYAMIRILFYTIIVRIDSGTIEIETRCIRRLRREIFDRRYLLRVNRNLADWGDFDPEPLLELELVHSTIPFKVRSDEGFRGLSAIIMRFLEEVPYDPQRFEEIAEGEGLDRISPFRSESERDEMLAGSLGGRIKTDDDEDEEIDTDDDDAAFDTDGTPASVRKAVPRPAGGIHSVTIENRNGNLFVYKPGHNTFADGYSDPLKLFRKIISLTSVVVLAGFIVYVLLQWIVFGRADFALFLLLRICIFMSIGISSYYAAWKFAQQAILITPNYMIVKRKLWWLSRTEMIPRTEIFGARGDVEYDSKRNRKRLRHVVRILYGRHESRYNNVKIHVRSLEEQKWVADRINRFLDPNTPKKPPESMIGVDTGDIRYTVLTVPSPWRSPQTVCRLILAGTLFGISLGFPIYLASTCMGGVAQILETFICAVLGSAPFILALGCLFRFAYWAVFGVWRMRIDRDEQTVRIWRPGGGVFGRNLPLSLLGDARLRDPAERPSWNTADVLGHYHVEIEMESFGQKQQMRPLLFPCRHAEEQYWLCETISDLLASSRS